MSLLPGRWLRTMCASVRGPSSRSARGSWTSARGSTVPPRRSISAKRRESAAGEENLGEAEWVGGGGDEPAASRQEGRPPQDRGAHVVDRLEAGRAARA